MAVDVISYVVGLGSIREVAIRQQFTSYAEAIEAGRSAKRRGEIWSAPVTDFGQGRWRLVGWYDGGGGVFAGPDDQTPATPENLFEILKV